MGQFSYKIGDKMTNEFLKNQLNVNWLRPETALWRSIDSTLITKHEIKAPSLDLGCGNGIHSFITAGGNFSLDYDSYMNTDLNGFFEGNSWSGVCVCRSRIVDPTGTRGGFGSDRNWPAYVKKIRQ